jgi:hypothetical protein
VSAWVRVVDLAPLLNSAGGNGKKNTSGREREAAGVAPCDVHAFEAGRATVCRLAFAGGGTRLLVVAKGPRRERSGHPPRAPLHRHPHLHPHSPAASDDLLPAPTHVYALRRGSTRAVVESVAGTRDERFVRNEEEDSACVCGESPWRMGGCAEPFGREGEGCGG